jgi:hypothetical protein
MIVKHVAEALRRQDWAAVAIEFVLVVAGVLLAFQINDWGSQRDARAKRDAASVRLLDEAEATVAYLRAGVETQQRLIDDLNFTLTHLQRDTWRSADKERMASALLRIINAAPPAPPSSVYDDLVASGAFGEIGDPQLRSAIADYRATLAYNSRYVDYLRQRMPAFESYDALRYVFDPQANASIRVEVDFPRLVQDSQLLESLALTASGQQILLRTRRRTLDDAQTVCRELGRTVGRPCDLHRPVPSF